MKILISHVFGYANKGDWALLDSLERCVRESFPSAELLGVCRDPVAQSEYFPNIKWYKQLGTSYKFGLIRKFENVFGLLSVVPFFITKSNWALEMLNSDSAARAYAISDLVICCPGGYIEDTSYGILTNLLHIELGNRLLVPTVLAPQSIGPINKKIWRFLSNYVFSKVNKIVVREEFSKRLLLEKLMLAPTMVVQLPDMAFYDRSFDSKCIDDELDYLGVDPKLGFAAGTVINWNFPFSDDPVLARESYVQEYAAAINKFSLSTGKKFLLLKQVENHLGGNGDDSLMKEIENMAGDNCIVSYKNYRPSEMKGLISKSSVFLGSRMHSNIFALQSGVPVVAIGYLPKTAGIMKEFGLEHYVVSIENIESDSLLQLLLDAMGNVEIFSDAKEKMKALGSFGESEFKKILNELNLNKE